MPKLQGNFLDGGSDSDTGLKTDNEFAKNYDTWRKKEELNKLKTKYGDNVLDTYNSSSSSEDDEDAAELTEEVEKEFYKTLSCLKKKDPKIYDSNVNFFKKINPEVKKDKKAKEQPMYLKDYERKLILEKGGILSDEEDETNFRPPTYVEEQENLKEEIIKLGAGIDEESDEEGKIGGFLELRQKGKEQKTTESEHIKWLAGQTEDLQDDEAKSELKPLKDFWNDPNLDSGEKFLRDYVLNKRYLDQADESYVPTYDEIIHDSDDSLSGDEEQIEKQEEFEHKFNFRFEEPDQEFLKRYPRTIEQSLRKTDDRRKIKRAETKERKKKEKEEKMAEIRKMQELKHKEIEEKLEKLKEVTGNTDLAFEDDDIDGDFDPEAHDRRMKELFNDEFYQGPEGDQKPQFPTIDEELEIENWDHWDGVEEDGVINEPEPHCEDDEFNMDADYDPSTSLKQEMIENSKGRKKRKRKSKVAEALSRPKPKFNPNDKDYEKYFDEYYKLDCEDIIGDVPCRFKYREVVPNDFGLTVEEILLAKDKELNRWCSLKKAVQRRPENVEKYDQIAYSKKASNIALKKKLLPSLFVDDTQKAENDDETATEKSDNIPKSIEENSNTTSKDVVEQATVEAAQTKKKRKNKKKVAQKQQDGGVSTSSEDANGGDKAQAGKIHSEPKNSVKQTKTKKRKSNKKGTQKQQNGGVASNSKDANGDDKPQADKTQSFSEPKNSVKNVKETKTKKRKRVDSEQNNHKPGGKKAKKTPDVKINISDSRLTAFGINPKKYKNKLKYGKKQKN